jgi:hypothetical protein
MVPSMTLVSQVVGHLPAAPPRLTLRQLLQCLYDVLIIAFLGQVAVRAAVQVHCPAGQSLADAVLLDRIGG